MSASRLIQSTQLFTESNVQLFLATIACRPYIDFIPPTLFGVCILHKGNLKQTGADRRQENSAKTENMSFSPSAPAERFSHKDCCQNRLVNSSTQYLWHLCITYITNIIHINIIYINIINMSFYTGVVAQKLLHRSCATGMLQRSELPGDSLNSLAASIEMWPSADSVGAGRMTAWWNKKRWANVKKYANSPWGISITGI